ncbi:hypothetical protein G6F59_015435 [Rhizopus arrhizus]|nr:hypothetical protein G6F59_015435 [Rhizopus arrhizus]
MQRRELGTVTVLVLVLTGLLSLVGLALLVFARPLPHGSPHRPCCHAQAPAHRRIAGQGQDDQQIPRQGLHGPGLVWACARPDSEGRRGRPGQWVRHALRRDRQEREACRCDRQGCQGRRRHPAGDRPGSRG